MSKTSTAAVLITGLALAGLSLSGCASSSASSSGPSSSDASAAPKAAAQTALDACDEASSGINTALTAYGEGANDGDAFEASALLKRAQTMQGTIDETAAGISNAEVKEKFAPVQADVAAMVATAEQQVAEKASAGEVSDGLNTQFEDQTNTFNDDIQALSDFCSSAG